MSRHCQIQGKYSALILFTNSTQLQSSTPLKIDKDQHEIVQIDMSHKITAHDLANPLVCIIDSALFLDIVDAHLTDVRTQETCDLNRVFHDKNKFYILSLDLQKTN